MTELIQQILAGLATGVIYAGLALALGVVFQGTGMLNLAQGELATLSAFAAWSLIDAGLPFWGAFPLAVLLSAVLGAAIERVLVRPVEGSGPMVLLAAGAAMLLGINALMALGWGTDPKTFASPFGASSVGFGDVRLTSQQAGAAALVLVTMGVIAALFRFTPVGLKLRAVATNPASARLLGIRTGRILALGWALAGAVGGVAGIAAAPVVGLSPDMMSGPLLLALAAATLGGMTSRAGAVVGGLVIGVAGSLASRYVPGLGGDLQLVVPFGIIFAVLLLRPQGLFGRAATVRA
ncbi:branched-chain amino acid ABC transporter permease [Actinomadura sp. NTSP31]|uniref:branched-chain amino acid ABC transporter permease n=1 Tax=Actinomadura sp. NTSP31 TaxID=1735447 RepID=UPI0035C25693